jgi:hypothetical protein
MISVSSDRGISVYIFVMLNEQLYAFFYVDHLKFLDEAEASGILNSKGFG